MTNRIKLLGGAASVCLLIAAASGAQGAAASQSAIATSYGEAPVAIAPQPAVTSADVEPFETGYWVPRLYYP